MNGTINITTTGGTGPYTYTWTGPGAFASTSEDLTGLGVGFYSVTATDANTCAATLSNVRIAQPNAITVTVLGIVPVRCFGNLNGEIQHSVGGGTPFAANPPYNFAWSDIGANVEDRTNIAAGNYTVTISDANNCQVIQTYNVGTPGNLTINLILANNPRCFGESNGFIQIQVDGGTQAYNFQWNDANSTTAEDLADVPAGGYTLLVTDVRGCTATRTFSLTNPSALNVVINNLTAPACFGGNSGSLTAAAGGGTGPYTYIWSGARTGPTINDLTGGLYCVTATDANSCSATRCTTLTSPSAIMIGLDVLRDVSCNGLSNGDIFLDVTGGTAGYTYDWGHIAGISNPEDIGGLAPGNYCVTVTDFAGCTASRCFDVREPEVLAITLNEKVDIRCFGQLTGTIDVSLTGGTQPYTIRWSGPNGFTATTEDIQQLAAGGYTLSVRDARNCEANLPVTINTPAAFSVIRLTKQDVSCNGLNDGVLGYDGLGGVSDYTFVWSRAGETLEEINDLAPGTYCVTVTDANSCQVTRCDTISEPPALVLTGVVTNAGCNGAATGGVDITVSGGTGVYIYRWSDGPIINPVIFNGQDLANQVAGNYCVLVADVQGCEISRCFDILEPAALAITNSTVTQVSCAGGADGAIQLTLSGGTTPRVVSWLRNGLPFGNGLGISGLVAGEYRATVTDARGCTIDQTFILAAPTQLAVTIVDQGNVTCNGRSDGFLEALATGGDGVYRYRWLHSGFPQARAINLAAGGYTVEVLDGKNCRAIVSGLITQPLPLNVTVDNIRTVACFGAGTGSISITITGGTTDYVIGWNGPAGFGSASEDLTGIVAGRYDVSVRDANGCTASVSNINVGQPAAELSVSILTATEPRCNSQRNGRITINATGGSAPYTYTWDGAVAGNTPSASALGAGTYCVTVSDTRGCEQSVCRELIEPEVLSIEFNRTRPVSCAGTLTGAIYPDVFGGTEPYQYRWTGTNPTYNSFLEELENVGANRYCLQVTDVRGCRVLECFDLQEPLPIVVNVTTQQGPSCTGVSDGLISVSVSGGDGAYIFTWVGPGGFTSSQQDINDLASGTYNLVVEDGQGCKTSRTVVLTNPAAIVAVPSTASPRCPGESTGSISWTVTGGSGNYTFRWSDNPARTGSSASQLSGGCYSISVTDARACEARFEACIEAPADFAFAFEASAARCSGESNGAISMLVSGGTAPYIYLWSDGSTGQSLFDAPAGSYFLTVRDSKSCIAISEAIEITEPVPFEVTSEETNDASCFGLSDGSLRIATAGGTAPYRYFWTKTGELEQEIDTDPQNLTGLSVGEYCARVLDSENCESRLCITITEPDSLNIVADLITGVGCAGSADGLIEVTVSGGTEDYTYVWSDADGSVTEDLSNVPEGNYCLAVTDANSCEKRACFDVPLEAQLATIEGLPAVVCQSADTLILTGTPTGGTFSGPISAEGVFVPANQEPGVYTIIYTVTDAGGCPFEARQDVRIEVAPTTAKLVYGGNPAGPPFCRSNTRPYTLTYSPLQADVVASAAGPGIRQTGGGFVFLPFVAGSGEHEHILTLRNTVTGCTLTIKDMIEVGAPVNVSATPLRADVCPGSAQRISVTGAPTYEWTPTAGVTEVSPGEYDLVASTTTSFTVTGRSGACTSSRVILLRVKPVSPVNIVPGPAVSVCEGSPQLLRAVSTGSYTYQWSPADDLDITTGKEVTTRPTADRTYTLTATPTAAGNCTVTTEIAVTMLPAGITASADVEPICPGAVAVLTAAGVPAGAYTYTWAPAAGLSATTGPIVNATPPQTTTYTVTRSGSGNCRSTQITVTVVDGSATITGLGVSYCKTDATCAVLTGEPAGGTFTGPGITGGSFCPDQVPDGSPEVIEITYAGNAGGCPFQTVVPVLVREPADAGLVNFSVIYCHIGNAVPLIPNIAGSTFSGPGVNGNIFEPRVAGAGMHTIIITPPTGCFSGSSVDVEVRKPDVRIDGLSGTYCKNSAPLTLTGLPAGGTFTTLPQGMVIGGVFDPSRANTSLVLITYSGFDGPCSYSTTVPVKILPAIKVTGTGVKTSDPFAQDGLITVSITGGQAPYEYSIDEGANWQSAPIFEDLFAGAYTICARDAISCRTCVPVTVEAGAAVCNAPSDVAVTAKAVNTATLGWTAVPGAVGYIVEYRIDSETLVKSVSVTSPSVILINLTGGKVYNVTVRTDCGGGNESPLSPEVLFDVPADCLAPTPVSIVPLSTSATASWPTVAGAVSYKVSYRKSSDLTAQTVTVTIPAVVLTSLTPEINYVVSVQTICADGESAQTTVEFATQPGLPACLSPTNVVVTPISPTRATLTWMPPVTGATGFVVAWRRTVIGSPWITVSVGSATATTFALSNLVPGGSSQLRIRTRCGSTSSPWTNVVRFTQPTTRDDMALSGIDWGVSVYPNPNRGQFTIRLTDAPADAISGGTRLEVSDLSGRAVWSGDWTTGSSETAVDLPEVASGLYILRVVTADRTEVHKLVIE